MGLNNCMSMRFECICRYDGGFVIKDNCTGKKLAGADDILNKLNELHEYNENVTPLIIKEDFETNEVCITYISNGNVVTNKYLFVPSRSSIIMTPIDYTDKEFLNKIFG